MGENTSPQYQYDPNDGYLKSVGATPRPDGSYDPVNIFALATELNTPNNNGVQFNSAISAIIKYYKDSGKINTLKSKLEDAFNIKIAAVGDGTFREALAKALMQTTATNFYRGQTAGTGSVGKQISVMQWLDSAGLAQGGSGSTGPTKFVELTDRTGAWRTFSEATKQLTGLTPSKKDFEEYYKSLNTAEKKSFTTRTVNGVVQTTRSNPFDINNFTIDFIVKKIDFSNPKLKNAAVEAKQSVEQAFNDNGVSKFFSNNTKINLVRGLLNGDITKEQLMNTVRNQTMLAYSPWAEDMKNNPLASFSDIISPYKEQYINTLEINGPVDIADVARLATKDGTKLSALEYKNALRGDSRWGKTKQANDEAAALARSFAQSLGVNV